MKPLVAFGLAFTLVLSSCGPAGLSTRGTVLLWESRPDDQLTEWAQRQPGMKLTRAPLGETWSTQIRSGQGPDLIVVEDGWEVGQALSQGLLADLTASRGRLAVSTKLWPSLATATLRNPALVPSSVYLWGLFYNPTVLKGLGIAPPTDGATWEKALEALKAAGKAPLTVGTSFGWPGLAWVSMVVLRNNGAELYRELLEGKRSFEDPAVLPALSLLQRWRDKGWFGSGSATKNWPESLAEVTQGDAGFALLGAYALNRVTDSDTLAFLPFPQGTAPAAELALVQGFVVSAKAASPEAALALADAYIGAGSPGQVLDHYRSPAVSTVVGSGFGTVQADLLRRATALVPTFDKSWPQEKAQAAGLLVQQFLSDGSKMSAGELASGLQQVSLR